MRENGVKYGWDGYIYNDGVEVRALTVEMKNLHENSGAEELVAALRQRCEVQVIHLVSNR